MEAQVFFTIASLVMLFMSLFTTGVLFPDRRWVLIGLVLFIMMYCAFLARIFLRSGSYSTLLTVLTWIGYLTVGVVSILFVAAAIKLVITILGFIAVQTSDQFSPARRVFLTQTAGSVLSLTALPMAGYGVYRALGSPRVKTALISNAPEALDGFKIVQLTDIHVGSTVKSDTVERIVQIANSLKPDAVVITGDLVDVSAEHVADEINPLAELKSTYGTYFVTGNHEYYSGASDWLNKIDSIGIKILSNSNDIIQHNGASLMMAGIPDIQAGRFGFPAYSPERAKETDKDFDYSVILSHRPEIADEIAEHGYDLQLSGHTHGGQYFPWTVVIHLFHKYVRGLYSVKNMKLYVSQGTAYWGPPIRLGAESEVTEIILTKNV